MCWHIWCTLSLGSALEGKDLVITRKQAKVWYPYTYSKVMWSSLWKLSGRYLKHALGLHQANHHVFQYWLYIILTDVILISMYQCWAVLTFLWESAHSNSYIMLSKPDWFFNILFFTSENGLGYQDFKVFHIHLILK